MTRQKNLIILIVAILVIQCYWFNIFTVRSTSMLYTLSPNQNIIGARKSAFFTPLIRGAIVVITPHEYISSDKLFIKRIMRIPGDGLTTTDLEQYICYNREINEVTKTNNCYQYNGLVVPGRDFPVRLTIDNIWYYYSILTLYEHANITFQDNMVVIDGTVNPKYEFSNDYYFLVGDNKKESIDSRHWGLLPFKNIKWICII